VWTSQFGGEFDQTPDENDVAYWNDVDDERREYERDNGQPRQPRYFPRQQTVDVTHVHTQTRKPCYRREKRAPDAAVNFDTYRILQRHRAVSLPQHGSLVGLCLQTAVNHLSKSEKVMRTRKNESLHTEDAAVFFSVFTVA